MRFLPYTWMCTAQRAVGQKAEQLKWENVQLYRKIDWPILRSRETPSKHMLGMDWRGLLCCCPHTAAVTRFGRRRAARDWNPLPVEEGKVPRSEAVV